MDNTFSRCLTEFVMNGFNSELQKFSMTTRFNEERVV